MMHVSLGLEDVSIGVLQLLGAKRLFPTMSVILVLSFYNSAIVLSAI